MKILFILLIVGIFSLTLFFKKKTNKREYRDKTTKQYKRWYK